MAAYILFDHDTFPDLHPRDEMTAPDVSGFVVSNTRWSDEFSTVNSFCGDVFRNDELPADMFAIDDILHSPSVPVPVSSLRPPQFNESTCGYRCGWGCGDSDVFDLEDPISTPIQTCPSTPYGTGANRTGLIGYSRRASLARSMSHRNKIFSGTYAWHRWHARHVDTRHSGYANRNHVQDFGHCQSLPSRNDYTCSPEDYAGQAEPYHTATGHQPDEESGNARNVPDDGDYREFIDCDCSGYCCDISWS